VNTCLVLLEVLVSHTVEVHKYLDKGLYLGTLKRSGLEEATSFKWTYYRESVGLVAKQ